MRASDCARALGNIARTYGGRGVYLRTLHEMRRAFGAFRMVPFARVGASTMPVAHPFAVDAQRLRAAVDSAVSLARADRIVQGEYLAYAHLPRRLPANAAAWHRNEKTGYEYDRETPWWKISHILPRAGDIKDVWEAARFAWAYDLSRAFMLTDDEGYVRAFEQHLSTWLDSSPPFRGVHWSCGQETSIRAIALLYAEATMYRALSGTGRLKLAKVLAASGERISDAIGYAISQRNNHGISEATGLIALGARFQRAHPEALTWLANGHRWLEQLVSEHFAPDGWYIQHSFNYLRVALDMCVVGQRVLTSVGRSLAPVSLERVRAACAFVAEVMNAETGEVPNHGANDGALVHPITVAPFGDHRPTLTAACATFGAPMPLDLIPSCEALAWLGADEVERTAPRRDGVRSGPSGWAVARMGRTSVFLRAGTYGSRPSHLDPLHVDVRLKNREAIVDPGTFAYVASPPWNNGLVSARVHNGPIVDNREPGFRGPRFLWLIWPDASITSVDHELSGAVLVAERAGVIRRTIRVTADEVAITDELLVRQTLSIRICWLLHPTNLSPCFECSEPYDVVDAREGDIIGWYAPAYAERLSSRALVVDSRKKIVTSRFRAAP